VRFDDVIGDEVLVHCPNCDRRAVVDSRSGYRRLTCTSCGLMKETRPRMAAAAPDVAARRSVAVAKTGNLHMGARLWIEAECCGRHRLWALNEPHLDYLERFVSSTQRDRDFPRNTFGGAPLADRLPAWMASHKHRDEVLRTIARLRDTL
jgi:hypothetical protein